MNLLPEYFPPLFPSLLDGKGEVLGLDRVKFDDFMSNPGADKIAVALTPFWSDSDFRSLPSWCKSVGCEPEDILLVLTSESRLRPDALNPKTGAPVAVGLNQMTRIAMQMIGKLPAEDGKAKALYPALAFAVAKMPVSEQFPGVVVPYFVECAKMLFGAWTPAKLYMANAAPSKLNLPSDSNTVIYGKGSPEYEANKGLDTNNDGQITMADLENAVNYHRETPEYVSARYRFLKLNALPPFNNPLTNPAALPGWPS